MEDLKMHLEHVKFHWYVRSYNNPKHEYMLFDTENSLDTKSKIGPEHKSIM